MGGRDLLLPSAKLCDCKKEILQLVEFIWKLVELEELLHYDIWLKGK